MYIRLSISMCKYEQISHVCINIYIHIHIYIDISYRYKNMAIAIAIAFLQARPTQKSEHPIAPTPPKCLRLSSFESCSL